MLPCCQQIKTILTYVFHTIYHQCYPFRACQTYCEARQEDLKCQLWRGILPQSWVQLIDLGYCVQHLLGWSQLSFWSNTGVLWYKNRFTHISNRFVSINLVPNLWVMHCRGLSQIGLSCPRFNLMFCSGVGLSREVCWELFVGPTVVVVGGNRW